MQNPTFYAADHSGPQPVSLRVADNDGAVSVATTTVRIHGRPGAPAVVADGPSIINAGDSLTLTAPASGDWSGDISYLWDLNGDGIYGNDPGETGAGNSVTFVPSGTGVQSFSVVASDAAGHRSRSEVQAYVNPNPPPPGSEDPPVMIVGDQALEGLSLTLTVSLMGPPPDHDVRVHVWTKDGPNYDPVVDVYPADGNDYAPTDTFITFPAGYNGVKTIKIATQPDKTNICDEWFQVFAQGSRNRSDDTGIIVIPRIKDGNQILWHLTDVPTKAGEIHTFSVTFPFGPSPDEGTDTYEWTIPLAPQVIANWGMGLDREPGEQAHVLPIGEEHKHDPIIERAVFTYGQDVPIEVTINGTFDGTFLSIPIRATFNVDRPGASFSADLESIAEAGRDELGYHLFPGWNGMNFHPGSGPYPWAQFASSEGAVTNGLTAYPGESEDPWLTTFNFDWVPLVTGGTFSTPRKTVAATPSLDIAISTDTVFVDSPDAPLGIEGEQVAGLYHYALSYDLYLMAIPKDGGVYVPVAHFPWSFSFNAESHFNSNPTPYDPYVWSYDISGGHSPSGSSLNTFDYPEWNTNAPFPWSL